MHLSFITDNNMYNDDRQQYEQLKADDMESYRNEQNNEEQDYGN